MPWSLAERQAVLSGRSIPTREQKPSNGPTAKTRSDPVLGYPQFATGKC